MRNSKEKDTTYGNIFKPFKIGVNGNNNWKSVPLSEKCLTILVKIVFKFHYKKIQFLFIILVEVSDTLNLEIYIYGSKRNKKILKIPQSEKYETLV